MRAREPAPVCRMRQVRIAHPSQPDGAWAANSSIAGRCPISTLPLGAPGKHGRRLAADPRVEEDAVVYTSFLWRPNQWIRNVANRFSTPFAAAVWRASCIAQVVEAELAPLPNSGRRPHHRRDRLRGHR